MTKKILLSAIVIFALLLSACGGRGKASSALPEGDTLPLRYAANLCIVQYPDYTVATVRNPWDTLKTLHTYILADKQKELPAQLPEGTVVRLPLERLVVYSVVHGGLLSELGALDCIRGVCGMEYFKQPEIVERCRQGQVTDCGNSMSPDLETLIELRPDGIMLSPYEDNGGYGRVGKLGVPIIECADYLETSPLGRAEWMRFYGILVGQAATADSLFAAVEREYLDVKRQASLTARRPTVLSDLKYGSAWYISGGNSTTGRLYADAGADYVFAYLPNSGSIPLPFETVFDKGQQADYWFVKYNQPTDKTYRELEQDYAPYARFKAFKERHVYGCNTSRIPYYEESPFHPDGLLKDIVKILHPELLEGYEPKYFSNLAAD